MITELRLGEQKRRFLMPDVLKGIAIFLVVFAHAIGIASADNILIKYVVAFIYTFHIPVFFFVSGYLHKDQPVKNFIKSVFVNIWIKFVAIALPALIATPLFLRLGVLPSDYSVGLKNILGVFTLQAGCAPLINPMWFVELMVIAKTVYFIISKIKRIRWEIIASVVLGCTGLLFEEFNILNFSGINTALLLQPIFIAGGLYRRLEGKLKKYMGWKSLVISAAVILIANCITKQRIDLSRHSIYGGIGFYPIVLTGLLFCVSLGAIVARHRYGSCCVCKIGRSSFVIMGLHIIVFKLIDGLCGLAGVISGSILMSYPASLKSLIPVYVIAGILIPILVVSCIDLIKAKAKTGYLDVKFLLIYQSERMHGDN